MAETLLTIEGLKELEAEIAKGLAELEEMLK